LQINDENHFLKKITKWLVIPAAQQKTGQPEDAEIMAPAEREDATS
jgi:hypothetical protein